MNQQKRIRTLMTQTNCTYDQALEADEKSNGNIDEALSIINNEVYVGNGQAVASAPDNSDECHVSSDEGNGGYRHSGSRGGYYNSNKAPHKNNKSPHNNNKSPHNNNNTTQLNEITSYKNGLLVNNIFYSFKDKKNLNLKKMLENNEFDANILNSNDSQAEVIFKNMEDEEYEGTSIDKNENRRKNIDNAQQHVLRFDKELNIQCPDELDLTCDKNNDNNYNEKNINNNYNDNKYNVNDNYNEKNIYNDKYNEKNIYNDNVHGSNLNKDTTNNTISSNIKFKVMIDHQRVTVIMNNNMTVKDFYIKMKEFTNKKVVLSRDGLIVNENDRVIELKQKMFKLVEEE